MTLNLWQEKNLRGWDLEEDKWIFNCFKDKLTSGNPGSLWRGVCVRERERFSWWQKNRNQWHKAAVFSQWEEVPSQLLISSTVSLPISPGQMIFQICLNPNHTKGARAQKGSLLWGKLTFFRLKLLIPSSSSIPTPTLKRWIVQTVGTMEKQTHRDVDLSPESTARLPCRPSWELRCTPPPSWALPPSPPCPLSSSEVGPQQTLPCHLILGSPETPSVDTASLILVDKPVSGLPGTPGAPSAPRAPDTPSQECEAILNCFLGCL